MYDTLRGAGFDPRFTPIDTLMDAPSGIALAVAEAMNTYDDTDDADEVALEGYQEWDPAYDSAVNAAYEVNPDFPETFCGITQ